MKSPNRGEHGVWWLLRNMEPVVGAGILPLGVRRRKVVILHIIITNTGIEFATNADIAIHIMNQTRLLSTAPRYKAMQLNDSCYVMIQLLT